jgi:IclR family acetate operon transcriptional repressor
MTSEPSPGRDTIRAISRAFEILAALAEAGVPLGLTEVAERTKLPLPTIHRILRTLTTEGYVFQGANRRYALGARLIPLARYAGGALGVALRPHLTRAVERVGESASVAVLDQDFARYISHVPTERGAAFFPGVGNQISLHSSGVGKAILSRMPRDKVERIIARSGLRPLTHATITDPAELLADIDLARERGYALDDGEHAVGVRCVAKPIPGPFDLAASISGPDVRMTDEFIQDACLPALRSLVDDVAGAIAQNAANGAPDLSKNRG